MGDNDVIVVSSDEEDEKTLFRTKANDEHFKKLFIKVKRIIFQRTRKSYIPTGFPYGRFVEFTKELERTIYILRSNNTKRFIWRCVVRWLVSLKNCIREPPLFDDWKYNYIVTDIMSQYINFKCDYYYDREATVVNQQIEEIIRMLNVAFSCKTEFVLITFLKIRCEYQYRRILTPVFRAFLIDPFDQPGDDFNNYLRLILCYRQWKRLTRTKENREMVNEYACGQIDRLAGSHRAIDLTLNPVLPWIMPTPSEKSSKYLELSKLLTMAKDNPNGTRMLLASVWHEWEWVLERYIKLYEEYNGYSVYLEGEVPVLPSLDLHTGHNSDDDVIIIPNEEVIIIISDDDEDKPTTSGSISKIKHHKVIEELKRLAESTPPKSLEEQERTERALRNVQSRYSTDKQGTNMAVNQHLSKDCDISSLSKTLKLSNLSSHSDQISRSLKQQIQTSYINRNVGGSFNENSSCIVLDTTDDDDSDNDDNYFVRDEVTDKDKDNGELMDDLADKEVEEINANEDEETVSPPNAVSSFIAELKRRAIEMGTPVMDRKSDSPIVLSSDDDEPIVIDSPAREVIPNDIVINEIEDSEPEDEIMEREVISPRLTPPVDLEERPLRREKLRCITGEVSSTTSLGCSSSTPNTDNASIQNENVLENAREVGTLSVVHTSSPSEIGLSIADYSDISDDDLDICLNESRQAPLRQCWSKFSKVVEEATSSTTELPIRAGSETPSENVIFSVHPSRRRKSTSSSPCPTRSNSPTDNSRLISPSSTIRTNRFKYHRSRYLKAISASRIPVPTFNTSNRISEDSEMPTCSRYIRRIPNSDTVSKENDESVSDSPTNEKPTCSRYVQKKTLEEDNSTQNSEEDRESSNDQLESNQYLTSSPLNKIAEKSHQLVEPISETVNEVYLFDESPSELNSHASQNDNADLSKFLDDITVHISDLTNDKDSSAAEDQSEVSSESSNKECHQNTLENITSIGKEILPQPEHSIHSKGSVDFKDGGSVPNKDISMNISQNIDKELRRTKIDSAINSLPTDCTSKNCDGDPFILNDSEFEHSYFSRIQEPAQENLFVPIASPEIKENERKEIITKKPALSKTENNEQSFSISGCQKVQKIFENTPNGKIFPENDNDLSYLQEVRRDSLEFSPLSSLEDDFLPADDELSNDENDDDIESPAYEPIVPKTKETKDKLDEVDNDTVKDNTCQSKTILNDLSPAAQLTMTNNDVFKPTVEDVSPKTQSTEDKLREENTSLTEDLVKRSVSNNYIILPESVPKSTNDLVARKDSVNEELHDLAKDKSFEMLASSNEEVHTAQTSNHLFQNNPELEDNPMCQNVISSERVMNDDDMNNVAPPNLRRSKPIENLCSIKETDSVSMFDSAIDCHNEPSSPEISMICEESTSELKTNKMEEACEIESFQTSPPQDDDVVCENVDLMETLPLNVESNETEMMIDNGESNNEKQLLTLSDAIKNKDQSNSMPMNESNESSVIPIEAIQDIEQTPLKACEAVIEIESKPMVSESSFTGQSSDVSHDSEIKINNELLVQQNKSRSGNEGELREEESSHKKSSTAEITAPVNSEISNGDNVKVATCIESENSAISKYSSDVILVNEFKTIQTIDQITPEISTNAEQSTQGRKDSEDVSTPSNVESKLDVESTEIISLDDKIEGNKEEKANNCRESSISEVPSKSEKVPLSVTGDSASTNSSIDIELEPEKQTPYIDNLSSSSNGQSASIDHGSVIRSNDVVNVCQSIKKKRKEKKNRKGKKSATKMISASVVDQSTPGLNAPVPIEKLLEKNMSDITLAQCKDSVSTRLKDQIISEGEKHLNLKEATVENLSKFAKNDSGESSQLEVIENFAPIEKNIVDKIENQKEDETNSCCGSAAIDNISASSENVNDLVLSSVQRKSKKIKNTATLDQNINSENSTSKEFIKVTPSMIVLNGNSCEMEPHNNLFEEQCSDKNSEITVATCFSETNENDSTEMLTEVIEVKKQTCSQEQSLDDQSEVVESTYTSKLSNAKAIEQTMPREYEKDAIDSGCIDSGKQFVDTNVESLENTSQAQGNNTNIVAEKQETLKNNTNTNNNCNLSEQQTDITLDSTSLSVDHATTLTSTSFDNKIQAKDVRSEDQDKIENSLTKILEEEKQNNEVNSDVELLEEDKTQKISKQNERNGLSEDPHLVDNSVNRSSGQNIAIDSVNTSMDVDIKLQSQGIATKTKLNGECVHSEGEFVSDKSETSENSSSLESNDNIQNNTLLDDKNKTKDDEVNKGFEEDQLSKNQFVTKSSTNVVCEAGIEGATAVVLPVNPRENLSKEIIENQLNQSPVSSSGTIKPENHDISIKSNFTAENLLAEDENSPQESTVPELEVNDIENDSLLNKEGIQTKAISSEKMSHTDSTVTQQDTEVKDPKQIVSKELNKDNLNQIPASPSSVTVTSENELQNHNISTETNLSGKDKSELETRNSVERDTLLTENVQVKKDEVKTGMEGRPSNDQFLTETLTIANSISSEKISQNQITVILSNNEIKKSKQNNSKESIPDQINQVPASSPSVALQSEIKLQNVPSEVQFDCEKSTVSASIEKDVLLSNEIQSNDNAVTRGKDKDQLVTKRACKPSTEKFYNTESNVIITNNQVQDPKQTPSKELIGISKSQSSSSLLNGFRKEELPAKAETPQKGNCMEKQTIRMVSQKQHHCNVIRVAKQILSIEDYAMIKSCRSPKTDSSTLDNCHTNTLSASLADEVKQQTKEDYKIIDKNQSNLENKSRIYYPNQEQLREKNTSSGYSSIVQPSVRRTETEVFSNNNHTCDTSRAKNQRGSEQSVIKKRSDVEFQEKVFALNSFEKQCSELNNVGNLNNRASHIEQNIEANQNNILLSHELRSSSFAAATCQSNAMYDIKAKSEESKRISNQLLHYVPRNPIMNMQTENVLGHGSTFVPYERCSQPKVIATGSAYPNQFKDQESACKPDNLSIRCVPFMNQRTEKDNVGNFTWSKCLISKPSPELISYNKFPQYFAAEKRYPPLLQGVLEDATYRSNMSKISERTSANTVEPPEAKKQKIQTDSYPYVDCSRPKVKNETKSNEEISCHEIRNESNAHLMEKNDSLKPEGNTPLFNTWSNEAEIQFLLKLRQNRNIFTGDDSNQSIQVQVAAEDLGDPLSSFDCETGSNSPAYGFETPYRESSTECSNSNSRIHYQSMTYPVEDIEDQEVSNITSQEIPGTTYNTYNEDCGTPVMDEKDGEEIESSPCQGKIVSLSVLKGIPELPQFPSNPPAPLIYQNPIATPPEHEVKKLSQESEVLNPEEYCCSVLGCAKPENHQDPADASSPPNEADEKCESKTVSTPPADGKNENKTVPTTPQINSDSVFIEPTPKPKPAIEMDSEYQRTPLKQRLKRRISQCTDINEEFNLGPSEPVKPMDILATQALERKYNESVVESVDSTKHSPIVSDYPINLSLQPSDQEKDQNLLYQETWYKKLGKTKTIDKTTPVKEHQDPVSVCNSQWLSDNSEALERLDLSGNLQTEPLPVEDSSLFGKNEGRRRKSIRVRKLTDVPERENSYDTHVLPNAHSIQLDIPPPMNTCHSLHTYPVIGQPPQVVETMISSQPLSILETTYNPEDIKAATILSDMLKTSYKVDESLKYGLPKTPKARKASNFKSNKQSPWQFRRLTRSTTQLLEKLPFIDTTITSQPIWPIATAKLQPLQECEENTTLKTNVSTETIWQQDNTKEILRSLSAQTSQTTDKITPGPLFGNANISPPPSTHSNSSSDSDDIGKLVIDMDESKAVVSKKKNASRSTKKNQTADQTALENKLSQKTNNMPELRDLSPTKFNVAMNSVLEPNPLFKLTSEVDVYSSWQNKEQPNDASDNDTHMTNAPLIRSERNSIEDDVRPFYPIIELTELSAKPKPKRAAPRQTRGRSYVRGRGRGGRHILSGTRVSEVLQDTQTCTSPKSKKSSTASTLADIHASTAQTPLQSDISCELSTSKNAPPETPEKILPSSVDTIPDEEKPSPSEENKLPPPTESRAEMSKEYWLKRLSLRRKSIEQVSKELADIGMKKLIHSTSFSIMESKGFMKATPSSGGITQTPSETTLIQDMKSTVPETEANKTPRRRKSLVTTRKNNKEKVLNIPPQTDHTIKSIIDVPSSGNDKSESSKKGQSVQLEVTEPEKETETKSETSETQSVDSEGKITELNDSTASKTQAQVRQTEEDSSTLLNKTPKEPALNLSNQTQLEAQFSTNSITSKASDLNSNMFTAVDTETTQKESNGELHTSTNSEKQSLKAINQLSVIEDKNKNCENVNKKIECSKIKQKDSKKSEKQSLGETDEDQIKNSRNQIETIETKQSDKKCATDIQAKVDKSKIRRNSNKKLENNEIDSKEVSQLDESSSKTVDASSVSANKIKCRQNSSEKIKNNENSEEKSLTTVNTSPTNVDKTKERRKSDEKLENNESRLKEVKQSDEEAHMSPVTIEKPEDITEPTSSPEVTNSELNHRTNVEFSEALSEENIDDEPTEKQDQESTFKSPPVPVSVVEEEKVPFKHKRMQIRRLSIDENNLKMTLGMSTEIVEKPSKHTKKHSKKAQRRFSTGISDVMRYDEQKRLKLDTHDIQNDFKTIKLKTADETATSGAPTADEQKSLSKEKDSSVDTTSTAEPKPLSEEKDLLTSVVSASDKTEADQPMKSESTETIVAEIKDSINKDATDLIVSSEDTNSAELEGTLKSVEVENMSPDDLDNQQHELKANGVEETKILDSKQKVKSSTEEVEVLQKKKIEEPCKENESVKLNRNLNDDLSAKQSLTAADMVRDASKVVESKVSRKRPAPKSRKAKQRSKKNRLEEVTTTDSEDEDLDESRAEENINIKSRRLTSDAKETSFDDISSDNSDESLESTDIMDEAPGIFKVVRSTVSERRRPAPKSRRKRNFQHTTDRNRLVVLLRRMGPVKRKAVVTSAENIFRPMQTRSMKKLQRRSLDCYSSPSSPISLRTRSKSTDLKQKPSVDQQNGLLKPLKLNLTKLEACYKNWKKMNCSEPSTSYEAKLYDERLEEQLDSSIKNILEDSEESSTSMLLTSRPQIFDRVPKDIFAENGSMGDNIAAKYYSPILPSKSYDIILKSTSSENGHLKTNSVDAEEAVKPRSDGNEQESDNEDAESSANNSDGNSAPDLELDASEMPHIPDVGIICEEDSIPDLCAKTQCLSEVLNGKIDKEVLDDKSTTFKGDYMISGNYRSNNYLDLSLLPDIDLLDVQNGFQNDNGDGDGLLVPKVENLADVEIDFGSELFLYSGCIQSQDSSGSSDEKREHECETPTPAVDESISSGFSTPLDSNTTSKEIIVPEQVIQDTSGSNIPQNYQPTVEVSSEVGFASYNELLTENNPFFPSSVLNCNKQSNCENGAEIEKSVVVESTTQEILENTLKEISVNENKANLKDSLPGDKPFQPPLNAASLAVTPDKKMVKDSVADTKDSTEKRKRERIKVLPIESLKPEHISSTVKLKCQPISFWKTKKSEPKIQSNSVAVENKTSTNLEKEVSTKTTKVSESSVTQESNLDIKKFVETVDAFAKDLKAVSAPSCEKTSNTDSSSPCVEKGRDELEKLPVNSTQIKEPLPIKTSQEILEINELIENNDKSDTIQNKETPSDIISQKLPELDEIVDVDTKHSSNLTQNKEKQTTNILQKLPDLNEIVENKHKLDDKPSCEHPSKKIRNETVNKLSIDDLFDRLKRESPVNPLMQKVKYGLKKSSSFETDDNSSRDSSLGLLTVPESPHTVISNVSSPAALICESPPPIIAPVMPPSSLPIISTPSRESENYPKINVDVNLQDKNYIETPNVLRPTKSLPVIAIDPIKCEMRTEQAPVLRKDLKRPPVKDDAMDKTEKTSQILAVKVPENGKTLDHVPPSKDHDGFKKKTENTSKTQKERLKKSPRVVTPPVSSPKPDLKPSQKGVRFSPEVTKFPKLDLFLSVTKFNTESKPIKSILVSPAKDSASRTEKCKNSENISLQHSSPASDGCTTSHNQKFRSLKIRSPHRNLKTEKKSTTVTPKTTQNSKSHSNRHSTTENYKYNNHRSTPTSTSHHSRTSSSSSSTETDILIDSLTAEIEMISNTLNRLREREPVTYAEHIYRKDIRQRYEQKMQRLHELKKRRYEESKRYNQTSSKSKSYSERQPFDNSSNHKGSVHNSHRDSKEKYKDNRRPYVNKFGELGTNKFQIADSSENRVGSNNCREAKRLPSWDLKTISAEEIIADLNLKKSRRN